jgi:ubiquinone/menaquinone biosynthesis C-methylase UbiE
VKIEKDNMQQAFDPQRFKQQERAGYNMIAARYEDASAARVPIMERMLELCDLSPGQSLLEVASGPGMLAREAARRVAPNGKVVAADIAEAALEAGRLRAAAEGLPNIRFQVEDAEAMSFAAASFDRIVCSMGLMHFPDAAAATRDMQRVLKPGGRLVAAVWGDEARVPFLACALHCLKRNLPPPKTERPSIFRFGSAAALSALMEGAGFADIHVETTGVEAAVPDAATYWRNFLDLAGVTTVALAKLPQEMQNKLADDVAFDLEPFRHGAGYVLPGEVLIVAAANPR